jgi:hypothetical protein
MQNLPQFYLFILLKFSSSLSIIPATLIVNILEFQQSVYLKHWNSIQSVSRLQDGLFKGEIAISKAKFEML